MTVTDPAILHRVASLLALSEDRAATPNEAAVAAAQAQRLMTRHRLSRTDVDGGRVEEDDPIAPHEPLFETKRVRTWLLGLANVVTQNNGCFSVLVKSADGRRRLIVIGRSEDVAMVRYLFTYLRREVDRLANLYRRRGGFVEPGSEKSFRVGVVTAISMAMTKARQEEMDAAPVAAVVRVQGEAREAEQWAETNVPGLRKNNRTFDVSDTAFRLGLLEGQKVPIKPGVENGVGEKKELKGR